REYYAENSFDATTPTLSGLLNLQIASIDSNKMDCILLNHISTNHQTPVPVHSGQKATHKTEARPRRPYVGFVRGHPVVYHTIVRNNDLCLVRALPAYYPSPL